MGPSAGAAWAACLILLTGHHRRRCAGAACAAELGQIDGLEGPENAVMVQGHFESIVKLADEVMELEENKDAGVAMLRAAFKLCPGCPLPFQGQTSNEVFYLDGYVDRVVMVKDILPALYNMQIKNLLWVGVQPYTLRYEYLMAKHGITMTSVEAWDKQAPYGSTFKHIQDRAQNVAAHVQDGSFDACIMNGVIGWGLDAPEDINATFHALHRVLRPGAPLVLGYNKPVIFTYWNDGLQPLFKESTLGSLPHLVDLGTSEMHHAYEFWERLPGSRDVAREGGRGQKRQGHSRAA